MKQILLLASAAAIALSAQAAVPFEKGKTEPRPRARAAQAATSRAAETQILLDEDFSRFSEGSEEAPAPNEIYEEGYHIPDSYTAQPGWTGRGVHPAGGCVALYEYEYVDEYYNETIRRNGYITTPKLMLDGTATFSFRARSLDSAGAKLWVAVCDDYYGPGDDQMDLDLTPEWKAYTLVATQASLEDLSYFQTTAEEGVALIDDIRLEFKNDRIAAPYALPAINKSATEFVACWEEVPSAEAYRLNVLCKTKSENPVSGEVLQNFDGLNINEDGKTINAANPGYPEGWTIDLAANGSQDVTTESANLCSAPVAVKFDAVGDLIESETLPYPLDGLSFWIKASQQTDDDYGMSLLRIELFHSISQSWENISHIPYNWTDPAGARYSLAKDALGDDVTKVRISMIQRGQVDFYLDDIILHYTDLGMTTNFVKDLEVKGQAHTVSGINPENEYTYYVQAVKGDVVSAQSNPVWVDGIVGLPVETEEPSEVSPTAFTASWKPLGHATDYKVETFRLLTPETDTPSVVVLDESFDNITEGTVQNPGTDWTSPFDFGAKGWASTGWGATQPAWAKGMAGTTGTNMWIGVAGLVFTPTLDLSCYDGNGITVEATVVTTIDSFDYNGQQEGEGMFAIILTSPASTKPIASGYMDTPIVGSNSGTMVINNVPEGTDLSNVIIAFMNKSGMMFFVDHAKITMNVPAGKTLMTPLAVVNTQETSCRLEDLDPAADHGFAVTASVTRSFATYTSDPSEIRVVRTSAGVGNVAGDDSAASATTAPGLILISAEGHAPYAVYTTAGQVVAAGNGSAAIPAAPGLYIISLDGSARKLLVK